MKEYRAMVWRRDDRVGDPYRAKGERVAVSAESLEEAGKKLEADYGKGYVYELLDDDVKEYTAVVWIADQPGQRVSILAENGDEAKKNLEAQFGHGPVFTLWSEEESKKPR